MLRILRYLKTNLIVLPIIRLAYKLDLFIFKRAVKLQLLLTQKLRLVIRHIDSSARLEGYDDDFDFVINIASLKLLNPEIFSDHPPDFFSNDLSEDVKNVYEKWKSEYLNKKDDVDQLLQNIEKNDEISKIIVSYNLVRNFCANHTKKVMRRNTTYPKLLI